MKREVLLLGCLLGALSSIDCGGEDDPGTPLATGGTNLTTGTGATSVNGGGTGGYTGARAAGGSTGTTGRGGGYGAYGPRGGNPFPAYDGGYKADAAAIACPARGVKDGDNCQQSFVTQGLQCTGPAGVKCICQQAGRNIRWSCPGAAEGGPLPEASASPPADAAVQVPDRTEPPQDGSPPEPDVNAPHDSGTAPHDAAEG